MILSLAILIQNQRVTDRHTYAHTHTDNDDSIYHANIALRDEKLACKCRLWVCFYVPNLALISQWGGAQVSPKVKRIH